MRTLTDRRSLTDVVQWIVAAETFNHEVPVNPETIRFVGETAHDAAHDVALYRALVDQHPHLADDQGSRAVVFCAMADAIAVGWSRADLLAWVDCVAPEEQRH
jgi:hypothetical protein